MNNSEYTHCACGAKFPAAAVAFFNLSDLQVASLLAEDQHASSVPKRCACGKAIPITTTVIASHRHRSTFREDIEAGPHGGNLEHLRPGPAAA